MTNSRARAGYILLDNHLATGTESTYTYTPATALDMKNHYRELRIIITGSATAAFALNMKINAQTNYDYHVISADSTVLTSGEVADSTTHILLPAAFIDGAVVFQAKVEIVFNDAGDLLMLQSNASAPHEGTTMYASTAQTAATTITSIEILVSTSTWIAGTEISIYGIHR